MKLECQNYTLLEIVALLRRKDSVTIDSNSSRERLAKWLEELDASRTALYDIQVSIASVQRLSGRSGEK
jgi:hypothetical protein